MSMIKEKEYKKRRDNLLKKIKNKKVFLIKSAENKSRSNDTDYPYRQDSDFYYLSGFKEDKSALVFFNNKVILFVQKKDKEMELWNGKRLGIKKAKKRFDVDEVYSIEKLDKFLKNKKIFKEKKLREFIHKMRLIKSTSEIKLIQKAIDITAKSHHHAMGIKKSLKKEYELQAEIEYIFKNNGAYSDAYTSIVASGNNANTLHYIDNNHTLKDGDLILIDAGCEYEYYASDITRTIPVNGKFTSAQKDIYNLVLDTQIKIIKMIKPGVKRTNLQKKAERLLTAGMVKLGILDGDVKKLIKKKKHKKYYPHGIGHWMGIDVHDQAPYLDKNKKEIILKKGIVLTIEPGLYIDKDDKSVPKKYRGIGIRIEDDILVTKNGNINMSINISKNVCDIENTI